MADDNVPKLGAQRHSSVGSPPADCTRLTTEITLSLVGVTAPTGQAAERIVAAPGAAAYAGRR